LRKGLRTSPYSKKKELRGPEAADGDAVGGKKREVFGRGSLERRRTSLQKRRKKGNKARNSFGMGLGLRKKGARSEPQAKEEGLGKATASPGNFA